MKNDLTDITVVLDRSGSMAMVEKDTKGGFDRFVRDQADAQGSAVLTLVQFDTDYEFVHKAKPIKEIPPLQFQPRGATALLDAVGKAIVETGERLEKTPEHDRPGKVVFVIITDGEENSSREYKKSRISEMIKHQTDKYGWQFVFLGANQDAIKEAGDIGILATAAMTYAHNGGGVTKAFAATSRTLTSFRAGQSMNMTYTAQEKKEAEEAV